MKTDWERFGRARKPEAPEITELNNWRRNHKSFEVASYRFQVLIHRAHTVMLAEQGIITNSEAAKILEGIKAVADAAESDDSLVGYMSTETALIKRIGDFGGKMHIGRSRNDLGHAQRRMYFRDQTERLIGAIIDFEAKLLAKAEENIDVLMPGYTHIRQAQPITMAHYLLAHVYAAARSVERLEGVYERTNLNTLGAAALAGTSWPIDRTRTMKLLGFNAICENSLDCVATIDYMNELASAISIHLTQLSQLAEDLQIWSSDEYNMIDLDEAYTGTSSIMPQKKNPLVLEQIKSHSAESIGNLVSTISSIKGVTYTNTGDRVLLEPVALDTAVGSTNVMAGAVVTMTPKKDVMLKNLGNGFTVATDLADALVRNFDLSFRQAHDIVVEVVLKAIEQGKKAEEISTVMVADASLKVVGRRLEINEEELTSVMDARQNLAQRNTVGGPAPDSVRVMINDRLGMLKLQKQRHAERAARLDESEMKLIQAEKSIILNARMSV